LQWKLFGAFNLLKQISCRLLTDALQAEQLRLVNLIDISDVLHQLLVRKLVYERLAHAFDIHYAARGKMQQPFPQLGRTIGVDAPVVSLTLGAYNHAAALRTMLRKLELAMASWMIFVFDHAHDFRDHITAPLNHHVVADEDAQAVDLILIVE